MNEGPSAVVQEVAASERVVVLEVRVPGLTSLVVIAATQTGGGVAVLSKGLRQELWAGKLPAGAPRQRGREDALVKARLLAIEDTQVIFEPWSSREGAEEGREWPAMARALRIQSGRVVVTDVPWPHGAPDPVGQLSDHRDTLEARGRALAASLADDAIEVRRTELVRAMEKGRQRIERRRAAIREDLSKIAQADRVASQAQWLIGAAKRTPRGAKELVATDWSSGEAVEMKIPLDPAKGASDQVEAMFKRAKRLKLGGRIAEGRLAQADAQGVALASAVETLRAATSLVELENAAREAKKSAPRDVALPGAATTTSASSKAPKPAGRVAYRTFLARSGATLLVGKGAADNDTLTLKVARPHDLWLHAKDRTGAHVIVPLVKGHTCPPNDLVDAAHLAAHFSDAREEKVIDIQYTPKRYLRKPKGSAPGAVIVDREKVMALRMEPSVLRELLDREEV